jgi:hypothetical protein
MNETSRNWAGVFACLRELHGVGGKVSNKAFMSRIRFLSLYRLEPTKEDKRNLKEIIGFVW